MLDTFHLLVLCVWALAAAQGVVALFHGFRFYRYVSAMLATAVRWRGADGRFHFQPRVAVILPCCGLDERLQRTVESVVEQTYDHMEVVFAFESEADPAYHAIGEWTRDSRIRTVRVTAGRATQRSQKIQNLLAALNHVAEDVEVLVFLDSDAVPPRDWLGHLVAPLRESGVGAATGYRWYTAAGGLACGVRSAWNAATVTLLDDHRVSFCWGGSTAVRRHTFERLGVRRRWERALSDDYQMTRAVRDAGLHIVFVPQALLPTRERTTLRQFVSFAARQMIITRVCGPTVWWAGFILCCNFMLGSIVTFFYSVGCLLGWFGTRQTLWLALAGLATIILLAAGKALTRQLAVRRILKSPDIGWRDFLWDVCGVGLAGALHLNLVLASLRTKRIVWRNTVYELISADETRVIGRVGDDGQAKAAPAELNPEYSAA